MLPSTCSSGHETFCSSVRIQKTALGTMLEELRCQRKWDNMGAQPVMPRVQIERHGGSASFMIGARK
ncbi:hypothetical protein EJB05_44069, partial [Eragrostis curvula]